MPAKTGKQYRYMQMRANNPMSSMGPSRKVAKEMISKIPSKMRSKWSKRKKKSNPGHSY